MCFQLEQFRRLIFFISQDVCLSPIKSPTEVESNLLAVKILVNRKTVTEYSNRCNWFAVFGRWFESNFTERFDNIFG